jgi:hypothetical protein
VFHRDYLEEMDHYGGYDTDHLSSLVVDRGDVRWVVLFCIIGHIMPMSIGGGCSSRMIDHLIIFIDTVGRFSIPVGDLRCTLNGFGSVRIFSGEVVIGEARLTDSGKGLEMVIDGVVYVSPVARIRGVLDGEWKKGPVGRRKGWFITQWKNFLQNYLFFHYKYHSFL